MEIEYIEYYTVLLTKKHPNWLFIFGSNLVGKGCGGQAIIRYSKNAYGIPTKKLPTMDLDAFFTDEESEENCKAIKEAIDGIPYQEYDKIILPKAGLGTGRAKMQDCPRTFKFLNDYLKEFLHKIQNK